MTISYEQFNSRLANNQELHKELDLQSLLEATVNQIMTIAPMAIKEDCYILLFDASLSTFENVSTIPISKNSILQAIQETSNDIDTTSEQWIQFSNELEDTLKELAKQNTTNPIKGRMPLDKVTSGDDSTEEKKQSVRMNRSVRNVASDIFHASNMNSSYCCVDTYYDMELWNKEHSNLRIHMNVPRGIYYVTDRRIPVMLTDCAISVLSSYGASQTDKHFSWLLHITNKEGYEYDIEVTSYELKRGKLIDILENCGAIAPDTKYLNDKLVQVLQHLAHKKAVLRKEEITTLGYHTLQHDVYISDTITLEKNTRVYVLSNGIETTYGFIPTLQAPFIPPFIPTYANGYLGATIDTISDDIMKKLFCELNTCKEVQSIGLALLGATCIVEYPLGDYQGTIPFSIEIVGDNGVGKTPFVNYHLSAYGTGFSWHMATLLNSTLSDGDTNKSKASVFSTMCHVGYCDTDYKLTPKNGKKFEKEHDDRNKINAALQDKAGRMYLSITRERRIVNPIQGLLIRTGNYDNALYSLLHDNEAYEKRTCTFLWNKEAPSNYATSYEIEQRREEYYALHKAYRQWIMQHSDMELQMLFIEGKKQASLLVAPYQWGIRDDYKRQTELMCTGLFLFRSFLADVLPDSFMHQWISDTIPLLIENRIERTTFIFGGMQQSIDTDMVTHILTAIKIQFARHEIYVSNQTTAKIYDNKSTDIPLCGLQRLGYHHVNGNSSLHPGNVEIGYAVSKGTYIAFRKDILFDTLQRYGKQYNIDFINIEHVITILHNANVLGVTSSGKMREFIKINNKSERGYILISMQALYSENETSEDTEMELDELDSIVTNEHKIIQLEDKRKSPIASIIASLDSDTIDTF